MQFQKVWGIFTSRFGVKRSISETTSLEENFLIIETLHLNSSFSKKSINSLSWMFLLLGLTLQQKMELY